MPQEIYLDANATTPLLPEVVEAMRPFWTSGFGNASSVHQRGQRGRSAVDHAREQVAALFGAKASEVVFTSGGTESDNHALFGVLNAGDHLVTTQIEHHAVLHAAEELQKRGVDVTFVAPDAGGQVSADAVRAALRPNTRFVSVMLANNETGVINPIAEIAGVSHQAGALLHTDAVQACGKTAVSVRELGCDLLTVSAHKMHGPQGVGALFVHKGLQIRPLLFGGAHERQRRAGTENLAAIAGFGCAAELSRAYLRDGGEARLATLRDTFERSLLQILSSQTNGAGKPRISNTSNIRFDGIDGDALVIALDLQGLAISSGSACSSGSTEPSHVLLAMGLTEAEAKSSVRISLSRLNTEAEIDRATSVIAGAVARLRSLSA